MTEANTWLTTIKNETIKAVAIDCRSRPLLLKMMERSRVNQGSEECSTSTFARRLDFFDLLFEPQADGSSCISLFTT